MRAFLNCSERIAMMITFFIPVATRCRPLKFIRHATPRWVARYSTPQKFNAVKWGTSMYCRRDNTWNTLRRRTFNQTLF